MAVPAEFTSANLSGQFDLNKSLTGDFDPILRMQGMGWFKRKAIAIGHVHVTIKNYKDDDGVEHVDAVQTVSGATGNTEERTLTWEEKNVEDPIFGWVNSKSRRVKPSELDEPFLKEGWTEDTLEHGVINNYVTSDTPKSGTSWIAIQTWGVEVINNERKYVRHVKFTGPKGEDIEIRMVYDYTGPV